jgi:hypothetical protein
MALHDNIARSHGLLYKLAFELIVIDMFIDSSLGRRYT